MTMNKGIYEKNISKRYIELRENALNYSNEDMNLILETDRQVYAAIFDIPIKSNIIGFQTQTLALFFGLNTHIYHGSGEALINLEKNKSVMKAMQSLLISSSQVLNSMELTDDIKYYVSNNIRAYLKTGGGIYFKELDSLSKESRFLEMLLNNVLKEISCL